MSVLSDAVNEALGGLALTPADVAAVELTRTYAREIDQGADLAQLGPRLLAALESLLMTPKARAALVKGGTVERPESPLDELRARRAARQRDTEAVDAAAS